MIINIIIDALLHVNIVKTVRCGSQNSQSQQVIWTTEMALMAEWS